jgi:hypothetical protein
VTTDAPPPPDETSGGEGASEAPRHPGGRPTKLTPEVVEKVKEGLLVGLSPERASMRAGITRRTYALWKAQGEKDDAAGVESEHAEFFHTIAQAQAEFAFDACDWLKKNRGVPSKETNAPTVLFMLERRYREDYGRSESVELTGKGGGPVQIQSLEDAIALHGAGPASSDDKTGA